MTVRWSSPGASNPIPAEGTERCTRLPYLSLAAVYVAIHFYMILLMVYLDIYRYILYLG